MHNVYHSTYAFPSEHCLCRMCDFADCPVGRRPGGSDWDFCVRSMDRGACPRIDCDYFHNRLLTVVTRYRYRGKRRASLDSIDKRLKRIEKLVNTLWEKILTTKQNKYFVWLGVQF